MTLTQRARHDVSRASGTVPDIAGHLAPIGLDELVDRAGLLTRTDRKYVLDVADLPVAVAAAGDGARVLEIGGERAHDYESIYLDTPALRLFHDAAHRRRRRSKVRMRHYVGTQARFLEVKTRAARGVTVKERMPLEPDDGHADQLRGAVGRPFLSAGGLEPELLDFVTLRLAPRVLDDREIATLRPVLVSSYTRTTLLAADGRSRITIDTGLRWSSTDGSCVAPARMCIVETKTPRGAADIDRMLWRAGARPVRMSKFATGLAALHPGLPSNAWHRVIGRAFGGVPTASAAAMHPVDPTHPTNDPRLARDEHEAAE